MLFTGVSCGIDSRSPVQNLYFKSGVVSKAVHGIFVIYVFGLDKGIGHQGCSCFLYVLGHPEICRSDYFKVVAQDFLSLTQFPLIARCKSYLHKNCYLNKLLILKPLQRYSFSLESQ